MSRGLHPLWVLVVVAGLAAAGCSSAEERPVRDVARDFHGALADQQWREACGWLAPSARTQVEDQSGQSCEQGLAGERLPAPAGDGRVEVFGTRAQLRYGTETVFLTRAGDGWQVIAAGCDPTGPRPYECRVDGS